MRAFFFTMHRSGSMVLHRSLLLAANRLGAPLISPNAGGMQVPFRKLATARDAITFPDAYVCGPLRGFIPFPQLAEAKALLHVRDPRDVLVSMFFSYCYSHKGQIPGDTGYRREAAERGIDWFVAHLSEADPLEIQGDYGTGAGLVDLIGNVRQRYQDYAERLMPLPQTTLLKYEDMMDRPDVWIEGLSNALGLADASGFEEIIGTDSQAGAAANEDQWAHRRQATPGDYRRKLKPETVDRLNDLYAPYLDAFGYSR